MIVDCPNCGKQISSKAPVCSHCGFASGEANEDEMKEIGRRKLRDRIYHLKMATYAVITVFVAGFGWYWYATGGFQVRSPIGPMALMAIAALGYIVARGLLFQSKRKLKKLNE